MSVNHNIPGCYSNLAPGPFLMFLLWCNSGKPSPSVICKDMVSQRARFKYALRYCKTFDSLIVGIFGSDSSKSTIFDIYIAQAILFRFLTGAKTNDHWGRHIGEIQYSHQQGSTLIVVTKQKGIESRVIPLVCGVLGRGI